MAARLAERQRGEAVVEVAPRAAVRLERARTQRVRERSSSKDRPDEQLCVGAASSVARDCGESHFWRCALIRGCKGILLTAHMAHMGTDSNGTDSHAA